MSCSLVSQSAGSKSGVANETYSLADKYQSFLMEILGQENIQQVRELPKDTFNPLLWAQLNHKGPTEYPTRYHGLVKMELTPGYLWLQEENYHLELTIPGYSWLQEETCNLGPALHWSTKSGWIYRACLIEDRVMLESYMVRELDTSLSREWISKEHFQSIIRDYLVQNVHPEAIIPQPLAARQFQRRLELIPIIFRVTRLACAKFDHIVKTDVNNPSVILGFDGENGEKFNALAKIRRIFFVERLNYYSYHEEREHGIIVEPVAPVVRTQDAFDELRNIKKMKADGNEEKELFSLDRERLVPRIIDEKAVADKSLKDLRARLVLSLDGNKVEAHEFKVLKPRERGSKECITLFVDFQHDAWKLQSQFTEKV